MFWELLLLRWIKTENKNVDGERIWYLESKAEYLKNEKQKQTKNTNIKSKAYLVLMHFYYC